MAYFRDLILCAGMDSNKYKNVSSIPVNYIDGKGIKIDDLYSFTNSMAIFDKRKDSFNSFKIFLELADKNMYSETVSKSLFDGVNIEISKYSVIINPHSPNLLLFMRRWLEEAKMKNALLSAVHFSFYLAYSIFLDSLITFTFICPGYSISFSTLFAMSLAMIVISASDTFSGFTIILTSLPAWIA